MMESQAAGYNTGNRVHDRFLNMDPTKPPKYSGRHYKHKAGKYNLTVMET